LVARVGLFSGATVAAGLLSLAALGGLLEPQRVAELAGLRPGATVAVGCACAFAVLGYLALAGRAREPIELRGFRLPLPPWRGALAQVGAGTLNFLLVASALRALLGEAVDAPLIAFAAYYAAANALSIVSHVPGGLGVLELVVLAAAPSAEAAGALVAFRVVSYLVPFALGGLAYAAFELVHARRARGSP